MLDSNYFSYENDIEFQSNELLSVPYETVFRQKPSQFPVSIGNIPPMDNYPPDFNSPPGFNFPGGTFNPPGLPKSPPPNYIPNKKSAEVQGFGPGGGAGISPTAVSSNSIRFCLYKFTYIWQRNGRSYWVFLLNVDRESISGFRWTGRNWVYFGISLRRIDSFVCYRSAYNDTCEDC